MVVKDGGEWASPVRFVHNSMKGYVPTGEGNHLCSRKREQKKKRCGECPRGSHAALDFTNLGFLRPTTVEKSPLLSKLLNERNHNRLHVLWYHMLLLQNI